MGILNITPDSFFDGGKYFNNLNKAINHTNKMIKEGADIIDIGGESTRPGYKEISVHEELDRVIPVIEAIIKRFEINISVDTSKPEVMIYSANAGAHIINDVRCLTKPGALQAAIKTRLFICLMHNLQNNYYIKKNKNILKEIEIFFKHIINYLIKKGIKKKLLIIDPGFGFGKNTFDNYKILSNLTILNKFNIPILVGISRKTMIRKLLNVSKNKSLLGSIACNIIACMKGAKILRVHDVKETFNVIKIVKTILSLQKNKKQYYV